MAASCARRHARRSSPCPRSSANTCPHARNRWTTITALGALWLLAAIAVGGVCEGQCDYRVWVSADGDPPPAWFVPVDYETASVCDAIGWIKVYCTVPGQEYTSYDDTITVLLDDGAYYESLTDTYRINMINNLTLRSVSGDPTQCVIDNGSPPGEEYAPGAPSNVCIMRSCHNFLIEGITFRGSELWNVVAPDVAERYPRKTFWNYVEINGAGDGFSVYDRNGNLLVGDTPFGRLTGDAVELPQPAGVGLGATRAASRADPAYLEVLSGAPGDKAWFHVTTHPNTLNGWMGPHQDDGVPGDVVMNVHTGDYGIGQADREAVALYVYGGAFGSSDGYIPGWYMKGTLRNCNFETSKNGARIIQACAKNGGPNGDEQAWVAVEGCKVTDIQGSDGCRVGAANVDVRDCTVDTIGDHWVYCDWTGTVAMPEFGNGLPLFGSSEDLVEANGPLTATITNTTFRDVELVDTEWADAGNAIQYCSYGQPWGKAAYNLSVDGCRFEHNWRDIWVCDSREDTWTEVHIENSTFVNTMTTALWGMVNGQPVYFENNSVTKHRGTPIEYYDVAHYADLDADITVRGDWWENEWLGPVPSAPYHMDGNYIQGGRVGILHGSEAVASWTNTTIVDSGVRDDFRTGGILSDCGPLGLCEIDNLWVIDALENGVVSRWESSGQHDVSHLLVTGSHFNGLWAGGASTWTLNKCTFAHTEPGCYGDGVGVDDATVNLVNSICAFNDEFGGAVWGMGTLNVDYCCAWGNNYLYGVYGDPNWGCANLGVGNIVADPMFAGADPTPPAGRNMLYPCWDLAPGSPCIDTGHPDPSYNDPDGSRADMGAIPYGAHEVTVERTLPPGQCWIGMPICPYEKDVGLLLPQGVGITIAKWDHVGKFWLLYPNDFRYVAPGEMLWVYIPPNRGAGEYMVSVTGVPVRTSVEVEINKAGSFFLASPFETPYNLHDIVVTKYSNVGGRWEVLERRTMLEDSHHATDPWINWHWSWHSLTHKIDYFNQPERPDNWIAPWQGYYTWVRTTALVPGSEKLGLLFSRDAKGAVTRP
jgi:hypothetical protein